MTCPRCKEELAENAFFCHRCGKRISNVAPPLQRHRRREKGCGTVYKHKNGADENRGKPYIAVATDKHSLGCYHTAAEAIRALDAYNASKAPAELRKLTLAQVYDRWQEVHYATLDRKSVNAYKMAYRYAQPLHDKCFSNLRTGDYQSVIDLMTANGIGHASCAKERVFFSLLCQWAMTRDLIDKNYASLLELPPVTSAKKKRVLSEQEIALIWFALEDKDYRWIAQFSLVLIYTGMRITELLTIERKNVFLDKEYMVGGIKTEAGKNRVIPIDTEILPIITEWMQDGSKSLYLVHTSKDARLDDSNVRKRFGKLMDKLKIKDVSPHTCRHTAGTRWAEQGVSIEMVKEILGHSSIAVTSDVYTHPSAQSLVDALKNRKKP